MFFTHSSICRNSTSKNTQKCTDFMIYLYLFITGFLTVVKIIDQISNRGITQQTMVCQNNEIYILFLKKQGKSICTYKGLCPRFIIR